MAGKPIDYNAILPALRAISLAEFALNDCCISMDKWQLLWETIGASDLSKVWMLKYLKFDRTEEIKPATHVVADVMRTNQGIKYFKLDPKCRVQEVWKTCIKPYVQRNLLTSKLDKLVTERDEELRAALIGHLLHANRDKSAAFFQILIHSTDLIVANTQRVTELQLRVQKETVQHTCRGRQRRAQA
jgi:hypothetical protein